MTMMMMTMMIMMMRFQQQEDRMRAQQQRQTEADRQWLRSHELNNNDNSRDDNSVINDHFTET